MFEHWVQAHQSLATFYTGVLSAIVTLSAVLVAWRTASSTKATVSEMKEARLQAVRPVLFLFSRSTSFMISWKRVEQVFPSIVFRESDNKEVSPFQLRNAMPAPAFDIVCDWKLDNSSILPHDFKLATLQQAAAAKNAAVTYADNLLSLEYDKGWTSKYEYNLSETSAHFELLGNEQKQISIPTKVERQIILRFIHAIEQKQLYKTYSDDPEMTLTVTVRYTSPSGERLDRPFKFKITEWGFLDGFKTMADEYIPGGHLPSDWGSIEISGSIQPIPLADSDGRGAGPITLASLAAAISRGS